MTAALVLPERFWAKVDKTDTCWLWTAATQFGYGVFWLDNTNRKAHRVAYQHLVGPVPEGLQLDHLCRVRNCVNPAHLEPVTPRVNVCRGLTFAAANVAKTHCPRGHAYDEANTKVRRGSRTCLTCERARQRIAKQRQRDEIKARQVAA